uniref:Uncharacterized protein n=1 Tax=Lepeophtheirus salmonis TaxID=72036 RepID=A0A0K2V011_LEPSM
MSQESPGEPTPVTMKIEISFARYVQCFLKKSHIGYILFVMFHKTSTFL